jgi:hypothetical protein
MVSSPAAIVFQIIYTIVYGTINTVMIVIQLFFKLLLSLAYIISIAGFLGILLSILILAPIMYLVIRFFSGAIAIVLVGFILLILFIFILLAL